MKKLIRAFLCSLLVVGAVLFAAACGDQTETPPTTPPEVDPGIELPKKKYIITFVVDGASSIVIVPEGEIPVFEGSTDKPGDDDGYYNFAGWDKELAPAKENTTYTAQYSHTEWREYSVRFIYQNEEGKQTTYDTTVRENRTPTLPDYVEQYKTTTEVYTFSKWSIPLASVTEEFYLANKVGSRLIYRAEYTKEERLYKVDFMDGEEVVYTENLKYEGIPEYKGEEIQIPEGYSDYTWLGLAPVTEDGMKCEIIFTCADAQQLETAYNMELMSFGTYSTAQDGWENVLGEASAVLFMALEVRNAPDLKYAQRYRDRVIENLSFMVSDQGSAPYFDLEPYWCYVPLTAAIAVSKATPDIWSALPLRDEMKYDIVMRSFAYVLTLGTADVNEYTTGPGLAGNFNKSWNTNYRLANFIPMLFVGQYFGGAAKVDALLAFFSYDKAISDFAEYACFNRAYARWTTQPIGDDGNIKINPSTGKPYPTAKDFMESGGNAYIFAESDRLGYTGNGQYGGTGKGVRVNYTAYGKTVDEIDAILSKLFSFAFSGGEVWSDSSSISGGIYPSTAEADLVGTSKAYIYDRTTSPVEGRLGLMQEFNTSDGGSVINGVDSALINGTNIRSSASYNCHNFIMIASAVSAFESLGLYDCDAEGNSAVYELMWVGITDFLYKYEHGYVSYSLGKGGKNQENPTRQDGYWVWKYWWGVTYADADPALK